MQEDAMKKDAMEKDAKQEDALQDSGRSPHEDAGRTPGGRRGRTPRLPKRTPGGRQKRSPEGLLREYLLSPGGGATLNVGEWYPRAVPGLAQRSRGQCP